jgi:SAM-dependent methyltransferase
MYDSNNKESSQAYWQMFWNDTSNVCTNSPQRNVGRTRHGVPISMEQWERTIEYIADLLNIKSNDTLIELCCGNALLLGPLAKRCSKAIGIDYSKCLLKQANDLFPNFIETIHSDALTVNLPSKSANVVLIYFAIQHFSPNKAIRLIEKAIHFLKPGGKLLVGDIPDRRKLWEYLNKAIYRKDYIQRILESRPMIGTWFEPEFFLAIGDYLQNVEVKILKQPCFLINSHRRFDVLCSKH